MHKKALTVAIAGALAAPMAAHAVDVTLSGHVNRALFINDSDASTGASVKDNGSSGTRIRVTGTGEMMDGGAVGVNLEYAAAGSLSLRYAEVYFSGDYGKVSIGQGNQGGEGSVYKGGAAVLGTGHGQDHNSVAKNYYTSLDGGAGRNERLRYDSPSVGPVSAAVSVGNGDQVSAGISMSQSFGGTSFAAGIGTVQWPGSKSTVSGSAGVTLASGISISGAWGKGKDHAGMTIPAVAAVANTPAMDAVYMYVDTTTSMDDDGDSTSLARTFDVAAAAHQTDTMDGEAEDATEQDKADAVEAQEALKALFATYACDPEPMVGSGTPIGDSMVAGCAQRLYSASTPEMMDGTPGSDAMPTTTDPSFFQVAVSYAFGDTSVGVSWYQANDMYNEDSELTAIGAGVDHNLTKLGTNVYAAVQNYSIEDDAVGRDSDDTVVMIGARIKF
jgi:hypothetical protein